MPFQIKQNTLNLSVPIERLAGAYYRIQRTKQNISLSCLAKELRMNKGFLSDLENGKRHFPNGLCKLYLYGLPMFPSRRNTISLLNIHCI